MLEEAVAGVDPLRRGFTDRRRPVPSLAAMLELARQAEREGEAEVWVDQDGIPRWAGLTWTRCSTASMTRTASITHYEEP